MEDEVELAVEILLDESGRYVRIPERKPSKAYKSMADFIETVEDLALKEKLSLALDGKGAFRRFKSILIDYPKERKRWHGYNAKLMKKEIIEWLKSLGVQTI
jgi:DNA polymerase III alpha subunit